MTGVMNFIVDSGIVGWLIMALGVVTLVLIYERTQVLFFKYRMNVNELYTKVHQLVLSRKADEAIVLCSQFPHHPTANAFKTILEKSDRDDDSIFQAQDVALAEQMPSLTQRIQYLSMFANVSTLMGLLGTIHGLILSFAAVAQADPAAKQAMLANGIAVSMYTTALGLVVAIPAMVAYSILVSRQNQLMDELQEKTGKLTELLTGRIYYQLQREKVYPQGLGAETGRSNAAAPPSNVKSVS